ncbi:hypothetical protein C0J52_18712 [Blattella germanica]|nr:hypothetical protein C0J52_18712 [Blattella germanica]
MVIGSHVLLKQRESFAEVVTHETGEERLISAVTSPIVCASCTASTYVYEQMFSLMKIAKPKSRNSLSGDNLKVTLRLSLSQFLHPNIEELVSRNRRSKTRKVIHEKKKNMLHLL